MSEYTYPILFGVIIGTFTRLYMLRTDYRQYPTYLHGKVIHIALGFIAAALGTVAIPSIMEEEFTAITFLTLAASQFREVRNMERNTLTELDEFELVPRGKTYIEGIAVAFEGRNYLVIFTSFITTLAYIVVGWWAGIIAGVICLFISKKLMSGNKLNEIVDIEHHELHFDGAGLYIDNIYIMNIGLPARQEEVLKYGMGFILKPKNFNVRSTIANLGQRQAILHDVSVALGVFRDSGTPALVPLAKRDLDDGRVGVFILPQEKDIEKAITVIGQVPVLENAIRMPTESKAHKKGRELS
ncbi:YIEGIA family protein [Schinkia azotoformans]|uniref:Sporulation protein involved in spore envelope assembly n=1 Tax=Schinkia azotoformans LMG 9581 TaxID=1131731 RepID=K6D4D4_SCHAZ|nr:YIEGIA family protein [Schinkia azotoformans]EKN67367.1 sporulation protein involved in spore envelope assembly [Schinkia azotoformans LMG 9581]MEC1639380.1 YIEGIA family protein [Schinkia azotoformans]MEC1719669.1 YIEGIA family protein [Schinkia azotoformans]MEC1944366.1 YIEGIA family protein [Schinkia azotoformans]MED4352674.1 YIEGIA family protein [Schinkia azotoformans]